MAKKIPKIIKEIKKYTPEEINFGYEKLISYSQLSMYNQCPRKWALQYIEGHKVKEYNIHQVFGTAMHETLQNYLNVMFDESATKADEINLQEDFEDRFRTIYKETYKKNNNTHFSSPEQLGEFFDDGAAILEYFRKNRKRYFSKRGWYLAGCEIPIVVTPNSYLPNVIFRGFLDVVLYHEPTQTFKILDIKTSTRGWRNKEKKDENKQFQLILYKQFFAKQFDIELDKIEIEFLIVKRKIYEESEFVIPRIQQFIPPSGKIKQNKARNSLEKFMRDCFFKEGYQEKEHQPTVNDYCKYCTFYKTHLCSATVDKI